MNKQIKLPCGINKNGEIVYIENAKNGLACECVCPGCKQPLIAKNGGSKREAHFAHLNTVECEHGYQSALHYLAKDLFLEIQYLTFIKNGKVERYKIDRVEIEQRLDTIIPDLIVICDGKPFIVEIFVTHALDDEKKAKIKSMMISTIEIDLSRFHNELITKDTLRQELCNPNNFSWIYDADDDLIEYKKELIIQYGRKIKIESSMLIACPIIRNYRFQGIIPRIPFSVCEKCIYHCRSNKYGYIACGFSFPAPLRIEEIRKAPENILCNQKKVLFSKEASDYINQFYGLLTKSVSYQIPLKLRLV